MHAAARQSAGPPSLLDPVCQEAGHEAVMARRNRVQVVSIPVPELLNAPHLHPRADVPTSHLVAPSGDKQPSRSSGISAGRSARCGPASRPRSSSARRSGATSTTASRNVRASAGQAWPAWSQRAAVDGKRMAADRGTQLDEFITVGVGRSFGALSARPQISPQLLMRGQRCLRRRSDHAAHR